MKIEVGKTYITASGEKAGPMVNQHHANLFVEEKENLISPYFHIRQSWNRDGTVCHSTTEDTPHTLVAEYVAPLVVEIGKKYVTKNGSIVGPMIQDKRVKYWMTCESTTVTQMNSNKYPQVWEKNGKVAWMCEGEEGHEIVAEYVELPDDKRGVTPRADAVLSGPEEIARLNSVIEGLTGKLQRVQNIHAHTIKTVRRARSQVKKVNAALSEEQRKNGALRSRLTEVARAVGEASEYVAKVSKPVVDIDVSKVSGLEREEILKVINGYVTRLTWAFVWDTTHQGSGYWRARQGGNVKLTSADYKFLKALLDR